MKHLSIITALILCLISFAASAQDVRTVETKIADLLVQMPAVSFEQRDRLAEDTYNLGEEGLKLICSQVVPPGTGEDTKARFARGQ